MVLSEEHKLGTKCRCGYEGKVWRPQTVSRPPLSSSEDPPEQVVISLATPCCGPRQGILEEDMQQLLDAARRKQKRGVSSFCQCEGAATLFERSINKYIFISATACWGGRATQLMGFLSTFRWLITAADNRHKEPHKSRLQLGKRGNTTEVHLKDIHEEPWGGFHYPPSSSNVFTGKSLSTLTSFLRLLHSFKVSLLVSRL